MRTSIVTMWKGAGPQQRRWVGGVAIIVAALALVAVSRPLPSAIARAESDVARTHALLENAQARIADNLSLTRAAAPVRTGDLRTSVDAAMARYALQGTPVASATSEGRYAVVVDDARFDTLIAALDALARDGGARVVAATITARVEHGRVRADLTFAR